MGIIRHWRWSALGASGVALLLPVGLAVGVALTTALGGGRTVRALGQVFAGPASPPQLQARGLDSARDVPSVPIRRRSPAAVRAAASPAAGRPTSAKAAPHRPSSRVPIATAQRPQRPSGGQSTTPAGSSGGDTAPSSGGPSRSPLHQVGQAVTDAVSTIPGPAGDAAGDVTQTVVDLIP